MLQQECFTTMSMNTIIVSMRLIHVMSASIQLMLTLTNSKNTEMWILNGYYNCCPINMQTGHIYHILTMDKIVCCIEFEYKLKCVIKWIPIYYFSFMILFRFNINSCWQNEMKTDLFFPYVAFFESVTKFSTFISIL